MRRVNDRFLAVGRLTPDLLGIVVGLLTLSSFATEWLNVHYIFGAFIMGACMPREAAAALREAILERLEQLSVLVLLPVFFVVSGVKVDLSQIDAKGFGELLAILGVAIGGKFLGAYLGARAVGVGGRQAGALATLMNTRGLTELVILNVGLGLGVLDTKLFTLMVLMALITTAMTGPIMALVYPQRLVDRDIADAERAALSAGAAYRVLVVVNSLEDTDLVDTAFDLAASRAPAEVLLARLVPQKKADRLEVGTGLGLELLVMTRTLADLHALAARGAGRGVEAPVYAKYSENDLSEELTRLITEVEPDLVLLDQETKLAPHDFMPRIVRQRSAPAPDAAEVAALQRGGSADAAAALQVAAQLSVGRNLPLVIVGGRGERIAAELAKHGIVARAGEAHENAIVVGSVDESGTNLVARARPDDEAQNIDEWAGSLSAPVSATQEVTPMSDASIRLNGIADYEFVRSLGRGNHGEFFVAHTPARLPVDAEFVAVKVLSGPTSEDVFRRATRELSAFASVQSPCLVALYDAGQQGESFYYAMEYLPDGSLATAHETGRPRSARWPTRRGPRTRCTRPASCTATSSRRTSCCTAAGRSWPTSA